MIFKHRIFVMTLLIVFMIMIMVSAGYAVDNENTDQETKLKTLTIGLNSTIPTLDPYNHRSRNAQTIVRNWTDSLRQYIPGESMVLDLAESITQLDSVTYEIKLKQGVTFHNGDPMTADDLVFSLTRNAMEGGMEGETSPRRTLLGNPVLVEKVDDYTVIVELAAPLPQPGRGFYNADIIPKKYFEEAGIEGFMKHPIGVGPFKWVDGDTSNQIVLERYENYHGGPSELPGEVDRVPALDRVIFKFIPESTTRVAALMTGEVDIIQSVPLDSIPLLESKPDIRVESTPGTTLATLFVNTKMPPFDDKRVRQALAYAIDYDLLVNQLLLGYSDPLYALPFIEPYLGEPGSGMYGDLISPYKYDPDKARDLLIEAGASEFSVVVDTVDQFAEQAQVVCQMLGDIGIDATVRVWDQSIIWEQFPQGERALFYFNFGWASRDPGFIRVKTLTGDPQNLSSYSNPVFDEIMHKALAIEEYTPEKHALLMQAYKILIDELPFITIHAPRVVEACRSHVKNFYPSGVGRMNLHRVDIE